MRIIKILWLFCVAILLTSAKIRHHTNSTKRIIGGTPVRITSYPYQIALEYYTSTKYEYLGGGALISNMHVLTGAYCVANRLDKSKYLIKAGYDGYTSANQISYVNEIYMHEQFRMVYNAPVNDIAVVKLTQPFMMNSYVQTVPLPAYGSSPSNSLCATTGFGKLQTNDATISPYLMKADVPIISNADCITAVKTWIPSVNPPITDTNICTMSSPTRGSCSGDCGNPLLQDGRLIGITSWGLLPCELTKNPTVYTKVAMYLYWINSKMIL